MSKKIFAILSVFALVAFMSTVMAANVKTVATKNGATLYSEADVWSVYVPAAGTVTVKDNKRTYDYTFATDGKYNIGLQKSYTGQLTLVDFEVTVVETNTVLLYFCGFQSESDYATGTAVGTFGPVIPYTVEMDYDAAIDWFKAQDFYASGDWYQGYFEDEFGDWYWDEGYNYYDDAFDSVLRWDAGTFFFSVETGDEFLLSDFAEYREVIYIVGIVADAVVKEEVVFEFAEVASYNSNLQDKNNDNLTFTVTVTMSDGSTYDVEHVESVNGGQKGSKTFDYANYSVYVAWNDNNKVTNCEVR